MDNNTSTVIRLKANKVRTGDTLHRVGGHVVGSITADFGRADITLAFADGWPPETMHFYKNVVVIRATK
jgi:hypothetical protein